jgi:hypothetical protein
MKMAFVVHSEWQSANVMKILAACEIDYYTKWEKAQGKGRGTEPHLGSGSFGSTNSVMMIAFQDDPPLDKLIETIVAANAGIPRAADRIRLFQMPLERIV